MSGVLAAALLTALLASHPSAQPQLVGVSGATLECAVLTAAQLRNHGRHSFLCVNLESGELVGAILRRSGAVVCSITGAVDLATGCYTVSACGREASGC